MKTTSKIKRMGNLKNKLNEDFLKNKENLKVEDDLKMDRTIE